MDNVKSPTLHLLILLLLCAFVSIVAVSIFFKVEIVAQGKGRIVPKSRVQVIQPEFTGQIKTINVRDGDTVTKGDVLFRLDNTDAKAQVSNLTQEKQQLSIEYDRIDILTDVLTKMAAGEDIALETAMSLFYDRLHDGPDGAFHQQQSMLLESEIINLNNQLAQLDARLLLNKRSRNITEANINRIKKALITRQERLTARKVLLDEGNISRITYLDSLDAFNEIQTQLDLAERELSRKVSDDQVILTERSSLLSSERQRLFTRNAEITNRNMILENELEATTRRLKGMVVRAPVGGIVDGTQIYTIGGLAKEGEELMRIVPADDEPEIEAIFSNSDIGFLEKGQTANIKLDAFPSARFGYIEGHIADVSADARKDDADNWGFIIRVVPDEAILETPNSSHPLQPGMTASIDVITGKRRLISYFFAPIVEVIQGSLGER